MNSLAPLANQFRSQIPSSAHSLGNELYSQENKDSSAQHSTASTRSQDGLGSQRLFHASKVMYAEITYGVASRTNTPIPTQSEVSAPKNVFDVEAVVANVMKYIEGAVRTKADSAATSSDLSNLLDQAKTGVETGVGEARSILSDMGLLDEDLNSKIDSVLTGLNDGIDDLAEEFVDKPVTLDAVSISQLAHAAAETTKPIATKPINVDLNLPFQPEPLALNGQGSIGQLSNYSSYDVANQFDLQIVTQDGDVVSVSAAYEFGKEESTSSYNQAGESGFSYSSAEYENFQLSYSVDGELDEGELVALESFMSNINELADTFYSGDMQLAFEQAMALDYDETEIASFALDLSRQETFQLAQVYQTVANLPGQESIAAHAAFDPSAAIREQLKPLQDFVQEVLKSLEDLLDSDDEESLAKSLPEALLRSVEHHPLADAQANSMQTHFIEQLHQHLEVTVA